MSRDQCNYNGCEHFDRKEQTLKAVFLVGAGGALGSLFRYAISLVTPDTAAATLNANLIGVALAGYFLVLMERRGITELRWFLLPGFCGGMTTFSAVTVEAVGPMGFGYVALTVIASIITIAVVIPFARVTIKAKA